MSDALRRLPITVEPVDGETFNGFVDRLAAAHHTETMTFRRLILQRVGTTAWQPQNPVLVAAVEQLGGLPDGSLRPSFERDGMWVRCGHTDWQPRKCPGCRRFAPRRSACRTCAGGMGTQTIAKGGAVCLRHETWTYRNLHAQVGAFCEYAVAEGIARTYLWERGIALHTGELNLAAAFVAAWAAGSSTRIVQKRADVLGIDDLTTFTGVLLTAYPEVIRTATVIFQGSLPARVLDVSVSALTQADFLADAVAFSLDGRITDELRELSIKVVGHAHRTMFYAYGLRAGRVQHRPGHLHRALMITAHRKRACLLRHVDPKRLYPVPSARTGATPPPGLIRKRIFVIDELALHDGPSSTPRQNVSASERPPAHGHANDHGPRTA